MNKSYVLYSAILIVLLAITPIKLQREVLVIAVLGIIWREVGK